MLEKEANENVEPTEKKVTFFSPTKKSAMKSPIKSSAYKTPSK